MELLSFLSDLIGLVSAIFAGLAWLSASKLGREAQAREARQKALITLRLVSEDGRSFDLPYQPLRSQLSRAEIAGVVGFYSAGKRFDLPRLGEVFSSGDFNAVVTGSASVLTIPTPNEEFSRLVRNASEALSD